MDISKDTINWLLEGDPSIIWQVKKDLLNKKTEEYTEERNKVSLIGWGKEMLENQDPEGTWAKGLYTPKWNSTTYTLLQLRRMGLPQENYQAQIGTRILLEKGKWSDGGINYFNSRKSSETCVTSLIFGILSYFKIDDNYLSKIFYYLKENQMDDGGWNCEIEKGAIHASMHTTLMALEALHEYKQLKGSPINEIQSLQNKGNEFLLQHELYKSHKTKEIIKKGMIDFSFPPRWKYNVLSALDYFRLENHPYDERFVDAIKLVKKKEKNEKWRRGLKHTGKVWFDMEDGSQPSRWNTLRAHRVLKWWKNIQL
ncbi:hypothetical protein LCGC14_2526830 [marine sediment metagenome]|uniref:Squalene cyclase C-terminal domain-containing protein n=1 Tax=marine sediment metagenome TaxID=412755 RepID=A0A0F9D6C1_9ZZZZ